MVLRRVLVALILAVPVVGLGPAAAFAAATIDEVAVSGKTVTATGTAPETAQQLSVQLGVAADGSFAPTTLQFTLGAGNFSDATPGDGVKNWTYTWDQTVNGTFTLFGEGFFYGTPQALKTFTVSVDGNMEQARIISINGAPGAGRLVAATTYHSDSPGGDAPSGIVTVMLSAPNPNSQDGGLDLSSAGYAAGTTIQVSVNLGDKRAYIMRNLAETVSWSTTGNTLTATAKTVSSYLTGGSQQQRSVLLLAAVVNPQMASMAGVTMSTNSPEAEFLPPENRNNPAFGLKVTGPAGSSGFFQAIIPGSVFRFFGMPVQGLQLLKNNTEQTAGASVTINPDGGVTLRFDYVIGGSSTQALRRAMGTLVFRVVLTKTDHLAPIIQGLYAKAGKLASIVGFRMSERGLVTVNITQGKTLVKQLKISKAAGGNQIVWNNRNAKGKRVAPGVYQAKISAADAKKNISKQQTVNVRVP